jgi:hypothetical protein
MVLLGLVLAIWLPVPAQDVHLPLPGVDVTVHLSGTLLLAGVLVALAATGADAVLRPLFPPSGELGKRIPLWVLPGMVAAAGLVASKGLWWGYQLVTIGITGLALTAVMVAEYYATHEGSHAQRVARLTLQVLAYVAAVVLYATLYQARLRGALLGGGTVLLSGGLALVLLQGSGAPSRRVWLYASVAGLSMGELTLALNYYLLDVRVAGALLLLVFYVITGLAQQHLWHRLTRRVALEFAAVAVAGLAVLAYVGRYVA